MLSFHSGIKKACLKVAGSTGALDWTVAVCFSTSCFLDCSTCPSCNSEPKVDERKVASLTLSSASSGVVKFDCKKLSSTRAHSASSENELSSSSSSVQSSSSSSCNLRLRLPNLGCHSTLSST